MDELRTRLQGVFETRKVRLALLFGSAAAGKLRPDSDVDVAVDFDPAVDFRERLGLAGDLSEAAGPGFGREFDIGYLDRADPLFLKKIFETAVLLHGPPAQFAAWRLKAFHAYEDFRPYLKIERAAALRVADRMAS